MPDSTSCLFVLSPPAAHVPLWARVPRCSTPTCSSSNPSSRPSRRSVLFSLAALATAATLPPHPGQADTDPQAESPSVSSDSRTTSSPPSAVGFRTPSGIQYVEYEKGSGDPPRWGDYVNIDFTLYTILTPQNQLIQHETTFKLNEDGYLVHHGNGEHILGLEEMLHTMRVGGKRRCIIPPSMAYTHSGFAPTPYSARDRNKFLKAINTGDGTVAFDLRVNSIMKDPDNRGYFDDLVLTDEEFAELWAKIKREKAEAAAVQM